MVPSCSEQISSCAGQRPGGVVSRSTRGVDYQDVPRPVAALADEYPPNSYDPPHSHKRGQLIYAISGVLMSSTRHATYVVPPQRALWVPSGVVHEARTRGHVSLRSLYLDDTVSAELPRVCRTIEVSALLRELIVEATRIPIEYEYESRDGRVMSLIVDEMRKARTATLHVPMPQHPQLVRVCHAILRDPAQNDVLDDWAVMAGMGRRTFTRVFRRETGVTFAIWRQNVRLMEAMSRLATGHSVTTVAFDVGYSSPSAFTAMFRRAFGVPPTQYMMESAPH
jgi:AraC-like DNA-binding protein